MTPLVGHGSIGYPCRSRVRLKINVAYLTPESNFAAVLGGKK